MNAIKRFEYIQIRHDNFQELKDFITQDHKISDRNIGIFMDEDAGSYFVREIVSRQYAIVHEDDFHKEFEIE